MAKPDNATSFVELSDANPTEDSVEITPAMLEAGVRTICQFFCWELADPEKIVSSVFWAMTVASRAAREDPSD
jgi:hypothetical protein